MVSIDLKKWVPSFTAMCQMLPNQLYVCFIRQLILVSGDSSEVEEELEIETEVPEDSLQEAEKGNTN